MNCKMAIKLFFISMSGIVELHEKHTGVYIKQKIDELCVKFGIKTWQIYTVTVDNGRNVVKAVELISENEIGDFRTNINMTEDTDSIFDDFYPEHYENTIKEYQRELFYNKIDCVRCGAHTINLVVNDVTIRNSEVEEKLREIIKIVKAYRKADYREYLLHSKIKLPPIPNVTRWNNYYTMCDILIKHREFYSILGTNNVELGNGLKIALQMSSKKQNFSLF